MHVLVPFENQRLFERGETSHVQPLFYRLRRERLLPRGLRRLALLPSAERLDRVFEIVEGEGHLATTDVFWLSPAVRFSPSEWGCLLGRMPQLKWAYSQITGTDHLDLSLFAQRGVALSNSGRLSSRRMAEMALTLILAHAKKLPQHFALQRSRRWKALAGDELCRQTVGIVGTGNIGAELAKLCRGIGMSVIGASRNPSRFDLSAPFDEIVQLDCELDRLIADVDHVVLALPLNPQTRGMFDAARLARMKPNSSLINLARGALVNEDALCDALSKRTLGAAYIDLPTTFPPRPWSRLYRTPNLVLLHNSAAKSGRLLEEAFQQFMEGVQELIAARNPANRII